MSEAQYSQRALDETLDEVDRLVTTLDLPESVGETATQICREAIEDGLLLGRSIDSIAAASVYAASRLEQAPRSLEELADESSVDRVGLHRTYRYVISELDLEIGPSDPTSYVHRYVEELDLSEAIEDRANELLESADSTITAGINPVSLAAAAIYAAARDTDEKVNQSTVSDVTEVSEVTIRKHYQDLLDAA